MNDANYEAYESVVRSMTALLDLDPDIDSPEGVLLQAIAKACERYEESTGVSIL